MQAMPFQKSKRNVDQTVISCRKRPDNAVVFLFTLLLVAISAWSAVVLRLLLPHGYRSFAMMSDTLRQAEN